jgi:putative PIN family toxin of toxin-antitoxin system
VPASDYRVVLDTNILVRAFINPNSSSGQILFLCEARQVIPLLSHDVLREYCAILKHPAIVERYPQLERPEIEFSLERLTYVSDFYRDTKAKFQFERDPKDAPLIELAIAGRATHLISVDQDLLSLPKGRDDAARRFRQRLPRVQVMKPADFLRGR